jgi:general secretion pathway protein E
LLASCLRGVLAQRLVRCLCTACKTSRGDGTSTAAGCDACGMTGFAGRTGVFELLEVDAACRAAIHQRVAELQLRERAVAQGMRSLQQDGQRLLQSGITSAEELAFATRSE